MRGKQLKTARERAGLTQAQLAERMCVSVEAIRRWEQSTAGGMRSENETRLEEILGGKKNDTKPHQTA